MNTPWPALALLLGAALSGCAKPAPPPTASPADLLAQLPPGTTFDLPMAAPSLAGAITVEQEEACVALQARAAAQPTDVRLEDLRVEGVGLVCPRDGRPPQRDCTRLAGISRWWRCG